MMKAHKRELSCYVIAGEPSGDTLGASVLTAMCKKKLPGVSYKFWGLGGPLMEHAGGFESVVPLEDVSVGGVSILRKLPFFVQLYRKLVRQIRTCPPDILLTFDAPELTLRVAKSAPKATKKIHCVAPSVWAWRPGRAKKMARYLDHLCCLFPFEPAYFSPHGLPATFVGHPFMERLTEEALIPWQAYPHLSPEKPLLLVMPGSRQQELDALGPVFLDAAEKVAKECADLQIVVLTLPHLVPLMQSRGQNLNMPITFVTERSHHLAFMRLAYAALVASGTATLELGLAGCPMVVGYRVPKALEWVLRLLVKTPFVSLPNIVLNENVVPELLQKKCTAFSLYSELRRLLKDRQTYQAQKEHLLNLETALKTKHSFGENVADVVAKEIG